MTPRALPAARPAMSSVASFAFGFVSVSACLGLLYLGWRRWK